jgi:hypothetical protein
MRVCVCILALVIRHAKRIFATQHYNFTWPVWLYQIFSHYLINGTIYGKTLLNIECVF